jgi:hypothetical protein
MIDKLGLLNRRCRFLRHRRILLNPLAQSKSVLSIRDSICPYFLLVASLHLMR